MNTEILNQKSGLDVIFPESRRVPVARRGATEVEVIEIYPMPLNKWKVGFKYIALIAPMLGFDLFDGELSGDQVKDMSANELLDRAEQVAEGHADTEQPTLDTARIYAAIMGEGGDLIIEFLAFAIDKDVDWVGGLYDEVVDIAVAVIELNLNFFIQRLLPKFIKGTKDVLAVAATVRKPAAR